jgi:hypothetical protein
MTIEEVVGVLEDLGATVGALVHDIEPLLYSEIPHVGETFDSLYYKLEQIDFSAKTLLKNIGYALKQAEGALTS